MHIIFGYISSWSLPVIKLLKLLKFNVYYIYIDEVNLDKKNEIAVYKKMDFHGILDEVLYISNEKYNETFTMYESGEGEPEDNND